MVKRRRKYHDYDFRDRESELQRAYGRQIDTEGKEKWSKAEDGFYGAGQSESDDPLPGPVLNYYPQFGHRDFVSLSTVRIEGGPRYHESGVFVALNAGDGDQKFIIVGGNEDRAGVSGSIWGEGSPTNEKWFEDASSYGTYHHCWCLSSRIFIHHLDLFYTRSRNIYIYL